MFFDELFVAFDRINAHTKNLSFGRNTVPSIAQGARLRGATGRIIFRIEIQNDRLSEKINKRYDRRFDVFSADDRCGKRRGWAASFWVGTHVIK